MSNFAVSVPSYLHVSHGDEDIIKDSLIGGKIIEFDGSMFDLIQKVKNMLLIKNIETIVFNDELHIIWEEDNNGIEYDTELSKGEPFIITLVLSNFYKEASINDLIENGIDRLVYKVEKENILLECVQATSVDNNIADIFNMNNNYRNAF